MWHGRSHSAAVAVGLAGGVGAALLALACSTPVASFAGSERPAVASPAQIVVYGVDRPDGSELVGVVSTRCETTNGASGLLSDRCDEETLSARLRQRAAEVGGTGLVDLECRNAVLGKQLSQVDGGSVTQTTQAELTCQASVVRGAIGAAPPASQDERDSIEVAGVQVSVWVEGAPDQAPSPREAVGEMDAFPDGYASLGRVFARCTTGCARSTARRALLAEAGKRGADAVAAVTCELAGEAWSCEAMLVGGAK